jgi:hypothetical protein
VRQKEKMDTVCASIAALTVQLLNVNQLLRAIDADNDSAFV